MIGPAVAADAPADAEALDAALEAALASMAPAAAAAAVAAATGRPRREVYRRALALQQRGRPPSEEA